MTDVLLTPADLGERVKIPADRVVRLCRERAWPFVKFGRTVRFTEEQAAQIVAMQTVLPKPKAATSKGQTAKSASRAT